MFEFLSGMFGFLTGTFDFLIRTFHFLIETFHLKSAIKGILTNSGQFWTVLKRI